MKKGEGEQASKIKKERKRGRDRRRGRDRERAENKSLGWPANSRII